MTQTRTVLPKNDTKLKKYMQEHMITVGALNKQIIKLYPEHPVSYPQLIRIYHGQLCNYQLSTLFRMCGALGCTPNDICDWESVKTILS